MSSFRHRGNARRRRGLARHTSSSRRLSSIVNPDLLNDVAWHTADQFSRQAEAPERRHSIANIFPKISTARALTPLPPENRAVSEKARISKSDADALLDEWRENERREQGKHLSLDDTLREVGEDEEDEDENENDKLFEDEVTSDGAMPTSPFWSTKMLLVGGLFAGYVVSSVGLQQLNSLRPGCGQLVTLLQYIATVAEQCPHSRTYAHSPVLPMKWHAIFVVLMFLSVQMTNSSLAVGLPFSLFLVIKNTNLVFSLLLGLGTGQSFTMAQLLSVGVLTVGISVCVLAQNQDNDAADAVTTETKDADAGAVLTLDSNSDGSNAIFGAILATAATFFMALLGTIQEYAFAKYGNKDGQEANESLFFTHLLGLPLFFVGDGLGSIRGDVSVLLKTPLLTASMLLINVLGTLVVKHSFVGLLHEGEAFTATLSIAMARMSTVVFAEVLAVFSVEEDEAAGLNFWVGAVLVAGGSLSYATNGQILHMCCAPSLSKCKQ